ncbi:NADPH-dependent conjugated polyketone reductase C2 [Hypsizygus marmoreus]|uniref:NADPH-dependent conjugated polyketone reductase C2 n=1 Tax=Hypsizygus marmoreus TaxID=39966 RepID=A0A369J3W7_HYPMA|nr:NADPH-dependent conjugated polyketone reductase C2 [Hypsizygus marmoreus]
MHIAVKIIYGTAWKQEKTAALVVSAVLQGFRAIDTACQPKHYREDLVGQALHELREKHGIQRDDLFLQTKYTPIGGQDANKPLPYNPNDPIRKQIESSFQKSLANLQTTYLDSYLLHSPLKTLEQTLEAWRALIALQDEGKVWMIGVSNTYDVKVLHALSRERKVQVVQNRWYEGNHWDQQVLNYCREHEIQYQSFWTLSGSPFLLSHPVLVSLAEASHCTPAQAIFKVAQLEGVTPLSGTTDELHMRQDVAVQDIEFPFSSEGHVKAIKALVQGG